MGIKLIWTGVFFIIAIGPALEVVGLHASPVLAVVGAVIFAIGLFLMWRNE